MAACHSLERHGPGQRRQNRHQGDGSAGEGFGDEFIDGAGLLDGDAGGESRHVVYSLVQVRARFSSVGYMYRMLPCYARYLALYFAQSFHAECLGTVCCSAI